LEKGNAMSVLAKGYKGHERAQNPDWSQSIGRAILNFSAIELQTYRWIEELCGDVEIKRYLKKWQPIGKRIDEITSAIEKHHAGDAWAKEAVDDWKFVRDHMADTRNELAHNPTAVINRNGVETMELLHIGITTKPRARRRPRVTTKRLRGSRRASDRKLRSWMNF